MMAQAQPEREKTWLEKLDEFLIDEFHYELYRVIRETNWGSDVMFGAWTGPMEFFECLNTQHKYVVANQNKPEHIRSHLQLLNFSGQETINGPHETFLSSQLPCNRQKILLLHALRLILENKNTESINLGLIVPIIRREIHQCIRLVFFHLQNGPHAKGLQDFIDDITQYQWLPMNDVRLRLEEHVVLWIERQGVDHSDLDDSIKLGKFWRTLNAYVHHHPGMNEPVDFKYGHLFSDWQKFGFCTRMIYEIDRLGSLVNLEALSHSSASTGDREMVDQLQISAEKRTKVGTRYQNLLAIHYFLQHAEVNCNNTKKAKFASFLTGFSENTLRQQWSNIHSKKNENGADWEADMKIVRGYFEDLGLSEVVRRIDDDLKD